MVWAPTSVVLTGLDTVKVDVKDPSFQKDPAFPPDKGSTTDPAPEFSGRASPPRLAPYTDPSVQPSVPATAQVIPTERLKLQRCYSNLQLLHIRQL